MLNRTEPPEKTPQTSTKEWSNEVFSADATARRRALLKGLGRGTAVLAATVPIQTLAGQLCPTSGTMSAQMSQGISTSASCPSGHAPAHWSQTSASKSKAVLNSWPAKTDPAAAYNSVFVHSNNSKSMLKILTESPDSDEAHWICAWLNSKAIPDFPYSSEKIIAASDPVYHSDYANKLAFLKKYMESKIG